MSSSIHSHTADVTARQPLVRKRTLTGWRCALCVVRTKDAQKGQA